VVTLVTPTGAFGGPVRVAVNQAKELQRRGHAVSLVGGWLGPGPPPTDLEGVPAILHPLRRTAPGLGFSGLVSVALVLHLWRHIPDADLLHVHLARDLVTLPAAIMALFRRRPFIIQCHGMIDQTRRIAGRIFDPLLTKPAIRGAAASVVLTDREAKELAKVAPARMQFHLPNGVPTVDERIQATDRAQEVLFCARLHPGKRVSAFVEMAAILRSRGSSARFVVAGPDEGCLQELNELIHEFDLGDTLTYEGPLRMDEAPRRIAQAYVYVLPAFEEHFPMALLEALSAGTPSVCTAGCEISGPLASAGAVLESDGSPISLADNVEAILNSRQMWASLSDAGRRVVREIYSISSVVDKLEQVYYSALPKNVISLPSSSS
jgi:glycosyltransferase involved in cell wall biosynthesis